MTVSITKSWQEIIKPYKVAMEQGVASEKFGTVVIEPLEKGYGITIGGALRRVLLSSIRGSAVTSVKFDGVLSEFSHIQGIKEDVTDILLNIKSMRFRMHSDFPKKVTLSAQGPCVVTASMIKCDNTLEIIDPSHKICTLDSSGKIDMELIIENGKGYVPSEMLAQEDVIGRIALDAHFSPVRKVSFDIEPARGVYLAECEKLTIHIETDGSISPANAVGEAASVLQSQFASLASMHLTQSGLVTRQSRFIDASDMPSMRLLLKKVKDVDFNVRCLNCMQNADIVYIGDLVKNEEVDLLRTPNFGRKSLNEIKAKLHEMGLSLGMDIQSWPPENMEQLLQKMEDENV